MEILYILPVAFFAGFVDAIAGGGGLIQLPGLLWLYPSLPVVTVLGTNKLASFCGTLMASGHYVRTLKIDIKTAASSIITALICSALGAKAATLIDNQYLKPIIFLLLLFIAIYALLNKKLGIDSHKPKFHGPRLYIYCGIIGAVMGFYDGFFGPATGSLLIFCFVSWLGFNFLQGSAFAKLTNLASNMAAMLYFASVGHIAYQLAIPMAVCNMLGNLTGARLAIKKGSGFVRWVFLIVVIAILLRFVYQAVSA